MSVKFLTGLCSLFVCVVFSSTAFAFQDFRVATFNIWGVPRPYSKDASRWSEIPREFERLGVDVILLQEGFTPEARRATYISTHSYFVRGPGFWGKLTSSGLYILSRWPIVRAESRAFSTCAGTDCLSKKGSVIATIERPDGVRVDVMNTHLNAEGAPSVRTAQIDTLALTIRTYRGNNPLVIGGDFNFSQDDPEYAHLMSRIPAVDTYKAWAESDDGQTYPEDVRAGYTSDGLLNSWKRAQGGGSRSRIDYLLLQNKPGTHQLRVRSSRLVLTDRVRGRHLSDHFGVETTFEVLGDSPLANATVN